MPEPSYRFTMKCDRCGSSDGVLTGSFFNEEMICIDVCKPKEQAHPKYAEAKAVEAEQVRNGNYNFPGIGKPADL